jgi:transcriptional regulator with XRE-family HTH domain
MFIIININIRRYVGMKKASYNIMPVTEEILKTMGEQIKLARLRRNLSTQLVAERAGISRASLWKVESGNPAVAMGIYAAVLHALNNMDRDLLLVAKDDEMGRELQDLNLLVRKRVSRRKDNAG